MNPRQHKKFGTLRSALNAPPSVEAWGDIVHILGRPYTWPEAQFREEILPYAVEHLAQWPPHLVRLPTSWRRQALLGHTTPQLQVLRALELQGSEPCRWRGQYVNQSRDQLPNLLYRLAETPDLCNLHTLRISNGPVPLDALHALLEAPHMRTLHTLDLRHARLDPLADTPALDAILALPRLHTLMLGHVRESGTLCALDAAHNLHTLHLNQPDDRALGHGLNHLLPIFDTLHTLALEYSTNAQQEQGQLNAMVIDALHNDRSLRHLTIRRAPYLLPAHLFTALATREAPLHTLDLSELRCDERDPARSAALHTLYTGAMVRNLHTLGIGLNDAADGLRALASATPLPHLHTVRYTPPATAWFHDRPGPSYLERPEDREAEHALLQSLALRNARTLHLTGDSWEATRALCDGSAARFTRITTDTWGLDQLASTLREQPHVRSVEAPGKHALSITYHDLP